LEIESSGAYSPVEELKEIIDFHRQTFDVGRFYRGQMRYSRRRGWRLITKYSYASLDSRARIRWFDEKGVLPAGKIKNGTERAIIFKVIQSRTLFFGEKIPQLMVYKLMPWAVEK
jgi:hypothetical protein